MQMYEWSCQRSDKRHSQYANLLWIHLLGQCISITTCLKNFVQPATQHYCLLAMQLGSTIAVNIKIRIHPANFITSAHPQYRWYLSPLGPTVRFLFSVYFCWYWPMPSTLYNRIIVNTTILKRMRWVNSRRSPNKNLTQHYRKNIWINLKIFRHQKR